jgi:Na+/proline symporter
MVQRYLCSSSAGQARRALLVSGAIVFVQFALFLLIGVLLYAFYTGTGASEAAAFTLDGRVQPDRVFPHFIVNHLPSGLIGLVVASLAAAAFTSSLNAQAATTIADFYVPMTKGQRSEAHYLNASRALTALWGLVQIAVGFVAIRLSASVVNEVLGIASFTNGVILGLFFLGTFTRRVQQPAAIIGMLTGAAVMLGVKLGTTISWQWYVLIGSLTTFLVGYAASLVLDRSAVRVGSDRDLRSS